MRHPSESETGCRVALPFFEGPLPLLRLLIRQREIEILDLPLAFLADQYSRHVEGIVPDDLTTAGEDLATISTLLHWKSSSILGETQPEEPATREEPSSAPWLCQLFTYKKLRDALSLLAGEASLSEDCFPSGWSPENKEPKESPSRPDPGLLDLAFERVKTLLQRTGPAWELPRDSSPSVDEQARCLRDSLLQIDRQGGVELKELLGAEASRMVLAVSFLALLELVRSRVIRAEQDKPFGSIFLWMKRSSA
ncbi:MAG: hypothetical protein PHO89_00645 [Methylacidiphilaceae bacterium]|nr:hypothetical protein [Candidatus Methylacidiphilaceae bacterium]